MPDSSVYAKFQLEFSEESGIPERSGSCNTAFVQQRCLLRAVLSLVPPLTPLPAAMCMGGSPF
jgi:hypothetical protein